MTVWNIFLMQYTWIKRMLPLIIVYIYVVTTFSSSKTQVLPITMPLLSEVAVATKIASS
jgi:hypothetical protein